MASEPDDSVHSLDTMMIFEDPVDETAGTVALATPPSPPAPGPGIRESVSTVTDGLAFALNTAKLVSQFGFSFAKYATSTSINVARAVVDHSGIEPTGILSTTLFAADKISNAGIRVGEYFTNLGLDAASQGIDGVGNVFGDTEMSRAIEEFAGLVQRELERDLDADESPVLMEVEEGDAMVVEASSAVTAPKRTLNSIGAVEIVKSITGWICLQRLAIKSYEERALAECSESLLGSLDAAERRGDAETNLGLGVANADIEELGEVEEGSVIVDGNVDDSVVLGHIGSAFDANNQSFDDFSALSASRLFQNIRRYVRFAAGSYGKLAINVLNPSSMTLDNELNFHNTRGSSQSVSPNHAFFSNYTTRPLPEIVHTTDHNKQSTQNQLLSSISSVPRLLPENTSHYNPTFYLILDHPNQSVVLCLRGTLSLHDLLVDLTCSYTPITINETPYIVHSGMHAAATRFTLPATEWSTLIAAQTHQARENGLPNPFKTTPTPPHVYEAVLEGLLAHPGYSLIVTGHSLGAGLASLITLQWGDARTGRVRPETGFPADTRIHCFSYATPAIIARVDTDNNTTRYATEFNSLITNVVVGNDFVPNLSLGSIRDLTNVVAYMHRTPHMASGLISQYAAQKATLGATVSREQESLLTRVNTDMVDACMKNRKLYPTGRSFWVSKREGGVDVREVERPEAGGVFGELVFGGEMLGDHVPTLYEDLIRSI
ncbi:hypothetical protein HDU98_005778 [Podochytrium sp. JEL0797]|nr:hypothetical protein HDU98_005778 [Podochytrium sp. JEL0797]